MRKPSNNQRKSVKILPKIDPGSLGNPLPSHVGARRLPKSLPQAPGTRPRAPEDDSGAIFLPHRYPTGIHGVSTRPNFARLAPWRQTIIKEMEYKQLKHRI